jgi:hypothetical protein
VWAAAFLGAIEQVKALPRSWFGNLNDKRGAALQSLKSAIQTRLDERTSAAQQAMLCSSASMDQFP